MAIKETLYLLYLKFEKIIGFGWWPFSKLYDILSIIFGFILAPLFFLLKRFLIKILPYVDEPHEKIVANFALIIFFMCVYKLIYLFQVQTRGKSGDNVFNSPYSTNNLSWYDALYFSFVVHFTLGFGDIFPSSGLARAAVIMHTTLFWFINLVDSDLVAKLIKSTTPSGFSNYRQKPYATL